MREKGKGYFFSIILCAAQYTFCVSKTRVIHRGCIQKTWIGFLICFAQMHLLIEDFFLVNNNN